MIQNCALCQIYGRRLQKEPLIRQKRPDSPWQKLACDFLDYGVSKWLVLIDYYSNWIELHKMIYTTNATSTSSFGCSHLSGVATADVFKHTHRRFGSVLRRMPFLTQPIDSRET